MSRNQSRGERNESTQYRKTGRSGSSNQQRNFPGGVSNKGGGGGASSATSIPASRGSKKYSNNAQGGYSRARSPNVESDWGTNSVHNGPHQQHPTNNVSDAPVSTTSSSAKLTNAPTHIDAPAVTRPSSNVPPAAPSSNVSVTSSESRAPVTPVKGDPAESFPLQFGTISPGFMNGVQIPARTSSAPPNLDEQKKAQAYQGSSRAAPPLSIPSVPKQQMPKNAGNPDQSKIGQTQPIPRPKRDAQVSTAPLVTHTQKPAVHPIPGVPMQMPFHQPQVPVQFGGPSPQIQSQAMSGTSLPLPMQMPLTMGNPPMPQPMFIPSLQPHPMHSQGVLPQVQNFNFSTQMGHQLPPRLGSMGINVAPQFPQQQAGKCGGSRKSVKITHPETHEELRLDSSPGARSHLNVPPQSQPIPSFPPNHPMNIYPNSYSATPIYYPAGSSVPMNSTQVPPTSQPPRLYNQVTVKPPVSSHVEKEQSPVSSSISVGKTQFMEPSKLHDEADSVSHQKEVDTSSLSSLPPSMSGIGSSSASAARGSINQERDVSYNSASASGPVDDSLSTLKSSSDGARKVVVPESINDQPNNLGIRNQQDQDGKQPASLSNMASPLSESELLKSKSTLCRTNLVPEIANQFLSTTVNASEISNLTSIGPVEEKAGDSSRSLGIKGLNSTQLETEIGGIENQGEAILSENLKLGKHTLEPSLKSLSSESLETTAKIEPSTDESTSSPGDLLDQTEEKPEESIISCTDDVQMSDVLHSSTQTDVRENAENSVLMNYSSSQDDKVLGLDTSTSVADSLGREETIVPQSAMVDQEPAPVLVLHDVILNPGDEDFVTNGRGLVSPTSIIDETQSDANVVKTAVHRGKKKMKELYRKAEAAGTSSDLYMAYKGPEEKKETAASAESMDRDSSHSVKQTFVEVSQDNLPKKPAASKVEPDDWEDVAEISPQLGTSKNENQVNDRDGIGLMTKRYSRDFLLKFVDQCTDLPEGFEITSDIADALMVSSANILHEHPSPGRNIDRPVSGSRMDRRSSSVADDDKWSKLPTPLMPGRGDMWTDVSYGGNIVGFRPGQGGNYGVLRNPRAPGQYAGGILSGLMQTLGPHGGLQRNYADADRWQRGTGFQKGLMPSPQTPPPVMHKAEKKYEIGKVSGEEEAKQRQLKAILNKLTPQNFEKLFQQVKQVNIDNVVTLTGVISQIFDKALMEPTFCQMYADFCFHLAADLPELRVENEKITFKRLLLNKCQEEFERGEREEEEANKAEEEGEVKQTEEEREQKRVQARRRMLGNIRLIGELYKKRMLTERIMHGCINKLLGQQDQNPDEENIEALCKLMSTIGEMIDHPKAKEHMDGYFESMGQLSNNMKLSSRVRFMLKDAIDLRKNKWQQRRKVEGPKKIEEVHRDAAQERQAQASRLARAPSMGNSVRRGPSMDFAPRAPSMLSSPSSHMGSFRAASPQLRGFGSQDARIDERQSFENRPMSVPLTQRPLVDDSITLGPQGGLVRGMGFRGQPSSYGVDARIGPGLNGFSSMPERTPPGQREDLMPRYTLDRPGAPSDYDQLHSEEQSVNYGSREVRSIDRVFDRSLSTPHRGGPPPSMDNVPTEKVLSEDQLRDKSLAAIKEFYSARDEKEVALCIKDLNSPRFYPSMISLWIIDSFERKDMERDILTKLLINLAKPRDGMISKDQLIKGFESVLAVLEDAVNDAPRAAEFLGRIFARVILENIGSLSEIGQLILEGGEEQGQLVETGLAAEAMGHIFEVIKQDKGDSVLSEIRSSCSLRLEDFNPWGSNKS